jgi:hypothetical protein
MLAKFVPQNRESLYKGCKCIVFRMYFDFIYKYMNLFYGAQIIVVNNH